MVVATRHRGKGVSIHRPVTDIGFRPNCDNLEGYKDAETKEQPCQKEDTLILCQTFLLSNVSF